MRARFPSSHLADARRADRRPAAHRRRRVRLATVAALGAILGVLPTAPTTEAETAVVRDIVFPVDGRTSLVDTFGACRDGCTRRHQGQDIFGAKVTPLVAAVDGTITWLQVDSGLSGNGLRITDADGWRYVYVHLNNDHPGHDDGSNPPTWRFAPGIALGRVVRAGELLGWLGDSGNAETTPPHLHFEIRRPDNVAVNPYESLLEARRTALPPRLYVTHALRSGAPLASKPPWGMAGAGVLACDLDGDGNDEPVVRAGTGFHWRRDLAGGAVTASHYYGRRTDVGVCGDWDGDGDDTFGVFRDGVWYLRARLRSTDTDITVRHGTIGDVPVVGDWDGLGRDGIGVRRVRTWYLRSRLTRPTTHRFTYGAVDATPLVGDWDGDGATGIGVRAGYTNKLRQSPGPGSPDVTTNFGRATDVALAGDFDGDGDDVVSVWRPPAG